MTNILNIEPPRYDLEPCDEGSQYCNAKIVRDPEGDYILYNDFIKYHEAQEWRGEIK